MKSHGYYKEDQHNKTDGVYNFPNGSYIEFFGVDEPKKVRGPRRDILFMNECNNISFGVFEQMEPRTRNTVFLDYNPVSEFWVQNQVIPKMKHDFLKLTYKDNDGLEQSIVDSIESRKDRPNWWKVYGLGEIGTKEGQIYPEWKQLDSVPEEARRVRRWIDFGYSVNPTAIGSIFEWNNALILDEEEYRPGMTNPEIANKLNSLDEPRTLIVADSAEPKSIDEIKSYGLNVIPSVKGPGSVSAGIDNVLAKEIYVTKRSTNIIKENRNYLWKLDRDGNPLNVPEKVFDHCFAPGSLVHTTKGKQPISELVGKEGYLYTRGGKVRRFHSVRPTRANAEVVRISFSDGGTLSVTPDHLLLRPDGSWVEAGLLGQRDTIQSVTYEGRGNIGDETSLQRKYVLPLRKVFQQLCAKAKTLTSSSMGVSSWQTAKGYAHSPQRWQQAEQPDREFRVEKPSGSPFCSLNPRAEGKKARTYKLDTSSSVQVAWVRSGEKVAQRTWQEGLGTHDSKDSKMRSLWERIRNAASDTFSVLPPELQNESPTKTVTRISRGREAVTYNLEVEDTHCFLVNGVIAHNCMDGIRYAISDIVGETLTPELKVGWSG